MTMLSPNCIMNLSIPLEVVQSTNGHRAVQFTIGYCLVYVHVIHPVRSSLAEVLWTRDLVASETSYGIQPVKGTSNGIKILPLSWPDFLFLVQFGDLDNKYGP